MVPLVGIGERAIRLLLNRIGIVRKELKVTHETTQDGRIIYLVWVKGKEDLPPLAEILNKDCIDNYIAHNREKMSQRLYGQLSLF